jgi:hypothetical protein
LARFANNAAVVLGGKVPISDEEFEKEAFMAGRHAFTKLAASSWWLQRALGGFPTPKMK